VRRFQTGLSFLRKSDNPALLGLVVALLIVDLFVYFADAISPGLTGRTACAILPFAELSTPLLPAIPIASTVSSECAGVLSPHTLTVITFMLKILLAAVAFAVMWLFSLAFEWPSKRETYFAAIQKSGGALSYLKQDIPIMLGILLLGVYLINALQRTLVKHADNMFTGLAGDFACLSLLIGFAGATLDLVFSLLFVFRRLPSENGKFKKF
jgi:hypothetical protein